MRQSPAEVLQHDTPSTVDANFGVQFVYVTMILHIQKKLEYSTIDVFSRLHIMTSVVNPVLKDSQKSITYI